MIKRWVKGRQNFKGGPDAMTNSICFKREMSGDLESMKEIRPTVILGACNPQLAFEAYQSNTDVASLLPCNAVVRDIGSGRVSVELAKPTSMMKILGDQKLI